MKIVSFLEMVFIIQQKHGKKLTLFMSKFDLNKARANIIFGSNKKDYFNTS